VASFQPDISLMFFYAHVDHSSGFTDVYFLARARYIPAKLKGRIFQDLLNHLWRFKNGSNIVFKILPIQSVVPFTYGRIC